MGDAICRRCGEPWELYYLAHEGLLDYPGDSAPDYIHDAYVSLQTDVERFDAKDERLPSGWHYRNGGEVLQKAVMRGEGCPACWEDPDAANMSDEESMEALRHNLFDSTWDGDPAELF